VRVAEEDPSINVRRAALSALQRPGDRRAIPTLLAALESEDRASREHAILGLERLKAREGVPGLIAILDDTHHRTLAARALVAIRDERALDPIRDASKSGWPRSRRILNAYAAELATAVGR
jgi:HEAT repeat protein